MTVKKTLLTFFAILGGTVYLDRFIAPATSNLGVLGWIINIYYAVFLLYIIVDLVWREFYDTNRKN